MVEILPPKEVAHRLRVTEETLRRWRRANIGPPYVMQGGKPRYRSDLIHAGDYEAEGLQDKFPAPKVQVLDASGLNEAEQQVLDGLLAKCPTAEWEQGSSLVIISTREGLDLTKEIDGEFVDYCNSVALLLDGRTKH